MTLVGYWPLTEDSGSTAYDYSGNSNDATANAATQGVSGVLGTTAYEYYSGTTPATSIPVNNPTSGPISVVLWGNPALLDGSTRQYLFDFRGFRDLIIGIDAANTATNTLEVWTGTWTRNIFTGLSQGTWYHLAVVFDGSTMYCYQDGIEVHQSTQTIGNNTSSTPSIGGAHGGGGSIFSGKLAEFRLYDHALPPSDIQYLYSVGESAHVSFPYRMPK